MKVSKLMVKLVEKRDKRLRFIQRCQEAMDALTVILINHGDIDVDSDIYYDKVYTENED